MAAVESSLKSGVTLKLNGGTNSASGRMTVKSLSLGKITQDADKSKIMPVVGALAAVLEYGIIRVERSEVSIIENA